jgi:tRNA (guanosine-2'-O-)-methyltransferase
VNRTELRALDALIDRHGPAAVCGVLAPMLTAARIARIDEVLAARLASVAAVVEDVYDPHNASAAIRTTEAIGLAELHVIERDPEIRFEPSAGVTKGCHRWIDIVRAAEPADAVAALHARGFAVYATLPGARFDVETVPIDRPVAAMFGNEHAGLSSDAVAACDGAIGVPMFGFTESYNLSVTVALVMTRLAARRRAHLGAIGDLPPETIARLRARWFAIKQQGAVEILLRALG